MIKFLFYLLTLAVAVAAQQNGVWRFKLSVTQHRFATPLLRGYGEVGDYGQVVFQNTTEWQAPETVKLTCRINGPPDGSWPRGPVRQEEGNVPGWLKPTGTTGLYDFRFAKPSGPGVLATDFKITELMCGGNCGGLQLLYGDSGAWYAYPTKKKDQWKLRYWIGKNAPPAGGYPVWVWRAYVA